MWLVGPLLAGSSLWPGLKVELRCQMGSDRAACIRTRVNPLTRYPYGSNVRKGEPILCCILSLFAQNQRALMRNPSCLMWEPPPPLWLPPPLLRLSTPAAAVSSRLLFSPFSPSRVRSQLLRPQMPKSGPKPYGLREDSPSSMVGSACLRHQNVRRRPLFLSPKSISSEMAANAPNRDRISSTLDLDSIPFPCRTDLVSKHMVLYTTTTISTVGFRRWSLRGWVSMKIIRRDKDQGTIAGADT